jgi:biopolymer transport protein ExbD
MSAHSEKSAVAPAAPVGEFTASFGLLERLKRPQIKVDLIPVLDLMLLALLISLLFTRFVMLPGVRVNLPETDLRMQHDASEVAVLTIGNQGMLFFAGSVYGHASIERAFRKYLEDRDEEASILLVKAEAAMELQLFLDLCRMAQLAGFAEVQIAGDQVEAPLDLISDETVQQGSQAVLFPVL